jgi:type II secretory pathway component GspD/PulD (secretin)
VSTLVDKSIGIVLSITPTFLDDDSVMLNIRASRSFVEDNGDTSNIALHLTRNSINASAIVKFGETFILNGLVVREKDRIVNGVPVLQDIPVLQYFFNRSKVLDYNRQILTLITVRRLIDSDESATNESGKTLLDSTQVLIGSSLGDASAHSSDNLPVFLAGGGFKHKGHLAFDQKNNYQLSNLYVRMLQKMGVETEKFGASTGTLNDLG